MAVNWLVLIQHSAMPILKSGFYLYVFCLACLLSGYHTKMQPNHSLGTQSLVQLQFYEVCRVRVPPELRVPLLES